MSEEQKKYTEQEAHKYFGVSLNNLVWQLLEKTDRTPEEDEKMIKAAYASCYHWGEVGTAVNQARGEWMISHVFAVLNQVAPALHHAQRTLTITQDNDFKDFELAYAYEAMARALAAGGDKTEAQHYFNLAERQGTTIKNDEDRRIFENDLAAEPWYGI
ncbi:MAG: hypothetical protein J0I20_23490 [Chloroflexi bacterium]|nr:hypothetical protein [Chloroflexota bacterium]OJW04170.1 MAG: hypothetical protein BGO39_06740 [Chloroflexi bacterium 54-19]